ncbi:MAG: tetratricopeptide repeat protein, partial [Pseudomonadota bacterium]
RRAEAARAMAAARAAWAAGKPEEAAAGFGAAALLAPDSAEAHGNLGVTLRRLGKVAAAIASHARSLALDPDNPGFHSNMGNALREAGRLEDAVGHLRRAVELAPDNAAFAYNLALALRDARRMDEALAMMEALVAAHPGNADHAWDLALTRLALKDYARGFEGYEARWGLARTPRRDLPGQRLLPGMEVAGRTVLLTSEQGFGDALQFARFVPLLARRGARVVLECLPELKELFAGLPGVAAVVDKHAPPPSYDLWAPMLSLAHILGVTWPTLPAEVPYLRPARRLARPLERPPGTVVSAGLVWAGKTTPRDRSWPLDLLLPLFEDPRVAWYSLQMGPRAADLAATGADRLVRDLAPSVRSFADTAAMMAELDLIVTIDTSAAHLAGALGRPTWVLLRYVSDWRWLDQPEDCAWYPTMRLFRQPEPSDFVTPVALLKDQLARAVAARSS